MIKKVIGKFLFGGAIVASLSSCASVGNLLNPFYDRPSEIAQLGEKNDKALGGGGERKEDHARQALDAMASYQRANDPQSGNPVMKPAVVRMMWIPDHLNKNGDLVPSHYYYLKVKGDQWAVTDAFELDGQLGSKTSGSGLPFVYEGAK